MDSDTFAGAACPASDLTARLEGELERARRQLTEAESRFSNAAQRALEAGNPIPFAPRRKLVRCRRQLAALARLLSGLTTQGGCHVEVA